MGMARISENGDKILYALSAEEKASFKEAWKNESVDNMLHAASMLEINEDAMRLVLVKFVHADNWYLSFCDKEIVNIVNWVLENEGKQPPFELYEDIRCSDDYRKYQHNGYIQNVIKAVNGEDFCAIVEYIRKDAIIKATMAGVLEYSGTVKILKNLLSCLPLIARENIVYTGASRKKREYAINYKATIEQVMLDICREHLTEPVFSALKIA